MSLIALSFLFHFYICVLLRLAKFDVKFSVLCPKTKRRKIRDERKRDKGTERERETGGTKSTVSHHRCECIVQEVIRSPPKIVAAMDLTVVYLGAFTLSTIVGVAHVGTEIGKKKKFGDGEWAVFNRRHRALRCVAGTFSAASLFETVTTLSKRDFMGSLDWVLLLPEIECTYEIRPKRPFHSIRLRNALAFLLCSVDKSIHFYSRCRSVCPTLVVAFFLFVFVPARFSLFIFFFISHFVRHSDCKHCAITINVLCDKNTGNGFQSGERWTATSQPDEPKAHFIRIVLRYGKWWRRHTDNAFVHLFSLRHSLVGRPRALVRVCVGLPLCAVYDNAMQCTWTHTRTRIQTEMVNFHFNFRCRPCARSFSFAYFFAVAHSLCARTCLVAWHIYTSNWFDWTDFERIVEYIARRSSSIPKFMVNIEQVHPY